MRRNLSNMAIVARFDSKFAANQIDITATDTVKNIVRQLYHKHVGVSLAQNALVMFYFVAPSVQSDVHTLAE